MAFLPKFIHLQPIFSREFTSLLRVLAIRTPWCVLNSSIFQQHGKIKSCLNPSLLFSTDSKTPKGKKDNTIVKTVDSTLQKRTRQLYTEEDDGLILERVKQMGCDNPETWKSLANELNDKYPLAGVKYPQHVKARYNLLVKRGSGKLQRRDYTAEEDAIIIKKVKEMGCENIETWKTIAKELNREIIDMSQYLIKIRDRYDLIINRDTKEAKRFTEEDDKIIMKFVKKYGEGKNTWKKLAVKLNMKHAYNVKGRHDLLVIKDNIVTGAFTEEEDRMILSEVEKYGDNQKTFKNLCEKLNRRFSNDIRNRFEWLQNKPSKQTGPWSFNEDQILIENIFQVYK